MIVASCSQTLFCAGGCWSDEGDVTVTGRVSCLLCCDVIYQPPCDHCVLCGKEAVVLMEGLQGAARCHHRGCY